VLSVLARAFRFWARLPASAKALIVLGAPELGKDAVLASCERPTFPRGVCTGCGCSEFDPCLTAEGPCAWVDESQRRCTACGPERSAVRVRARKR
jgi:hypothetical protein